MIQKWRESGQNKAAFCRAREIPVWKLHYWFRQLERRQQAGESPAGFVEVAEDGGTGLRLRLPNGVAVEIDQGFDAQTLRRVLLVWAEVC